jgi:hypothetical protein
VALKRFAAVSGCGLLIYLLFFGGHYVSGDNAQRIAWAKALIDCLCNNIAPYMPGAHFPPGRPYTKYGIGLPLLHVPLIMLARLVTRTSGIPIEGPLNMLLYTFNGALGIAFLYLVLLRQGVRWRTAAMAALAIGVGSVWFAYSKVEYAEVIVTTLILAMYLLADDHPWLAGLLGGYAVAVRMDAIIWVGLTGLIVPSNWKKSWLPIGFSAVPGLVLVAVSNYARTGSPLSSGYEQHGFSGPILIGIYGLLFSAGKSLFLFSPLMVLYPAAARKLWRDPARRRFVAWSLALLVAQLLLYAKWWDWSGDDAWGPRFLVAATMVCLAVVAASDYVSSRWFAALAMLDVLVELPGVLLGPHNSLMLVHLLNPMKTDANTHLRSPITLDDMRFDPKYAQVTATSELLLFKLFGGWLPLGSYLASFDPKLQPADIEIDIQWLHPHPQRRGSRHSD